MDRAQFTALCCSNTHGRCGNLRQFQRQLFPNQGSVARSCGVLIPSVLSIPGGKWAFHVDDSAWGRQMKAAGWSCERESLQQHKTHRRDWRRGTARKQRSAGVNQGEVGGQGRVQMWIREPSGDRLRFRASHCLPCRQWRPPLPPEIGFLQPRWLLGQPREASDCGVKNDVVFVAVNQVQFFHYQDLPFA
jgi:hypothetical protein